LHPRHASKKNFCVAESAGVKLVLFVVRFVQVWLPPSRQTILSAHAFGKCRPAMFDERRKAALAAGQLVPAERRVYPRYHFCAAVEALDQGHRTRMNARTSDISRGGCYVDTFSPFPLKTSVKLRLTCEKSAFMADATVVSSKIGMGMGLRFTSMDPKQLPVLEKWLCELNGTAHFEPRETVGFPAHSNGNEKNGCAPKETGYVLNELILALMRKGALTEEEGKTMLLRLLHRDFLP
jgi:hypothetical protein